MLIDIKGTYSKINTLTANKYLGFYDANKVFPVIWRVGKTVNTLPFQGKDGGFNSPTRYQLKTLRDAGKTDVSCKTTVLRCCGDIPKKGEVGSNPINTSNY